MSFLISNPKQFLHYIHKLRQGKSVRRNVLYVEQVEILIEKIGENRRSIALVNHTEF